MWRRHVFLGEDSWYAIRISSGMLDRIKYIAAYQTLPISAITHYAPIERIEPYREGAKYNSYFPRRRRKLIPFLLQMHPLVQCRDHDIRLSRSLRLQRS